jgi:aldehyde dehydrogenase (NAD+)
MPIFKNYINGQWVATDATNQNINPSDTNDIVGDYAQGNRAQTIEAINAAEEASKTWRFSNIQQRFDSLDFIGSEILARKDELGKLLAREEGKTLPEAIGEVARAGQIFKFFAGEALRIPGDHMASIRPGVTVDVTREALGVVGIITPWNFPIAIPAWKIAPALAYGNTVIIKPAELVPASTWSLTEIISRSGLPNGVYNMVMGAGREVGQTLLEDHRVNAISFTGSVNTGAKVAATCSVRNAKYQLEMGGKNPLVVLADADIDNAVACALNGAFYSTGQRCTASSRLIVEAAIHDQFVDRMAKEVANLKVGHALEETTQIGPVIDQRQLDQNRKYVAVGKEEGANLICGGDIAEMATPGFYMTPALFAETNNSMQINREEIFGPIATILKVNDIDEAITVANDTDFGLSAGICTSSLKSANTFKARSQAGMVMVNLPTAGVDYHVPFGGIKGSSYGSREQGRHAAEFYTAVKTAYSLA